MQGLALGDLRQAEAGVEFLRDPGWSRIIDQVHLDVGNAFKIVKLGQITFAVNLIPSVGADHAPGLFVRSSMYLSLASEAALLPRPDDPHPHDALAFRTP